MIVFKFPPSTGRPINPVDGVLKLLPISKAQSPVSNLEMIDDSNQRSSVFKTLHLQTTTFTFKSTIEPDHLHRKSDNFATDKRLKSYI